MSRMANYLGWPVLALLLGTAMAADSAGRRLAAGRYTQAAAGSSLIFTFIAARRRQQRAIQTSSPPSFTYDDKNPAAGSLEVKIDIASLDTQDAERDDALKGADLFDTKGHPSATYVAKSLARNSAGGLEAVGKLTLRGVSKDLRLPLTLKPTANGLELSGQTSIKRLDYGVGQGEWQSTESVGDEVKIQYKVTLVRAK